MPFSRYTLGRNKKERMETLEMVCGRRKRTILRFLIEDIQTFDLWTGARYASTLHDIHAPFVLAITTIPELVLTSQTP